MTAETWADGYTAGTHRGRHDAAAEHDGSYRREPNHHGHEGETPNNGADWVDGFLAGYADGRAGGA